MIISFSVGNFRSFSEEQTLNLIASGRYRDHHKNHLVELPGTEESVLRTAVIYGANGAGKSNIFKALTFLRKLVVTPKTKGAETGREVFRFNESFADQPTVLTLRLLADSRIFEFGVKLNDDNILEEWLIEIEGNREKPIYERVTDANNKVTVEGKALEGEKLKALVLVGGRPEQTFLATVRSTLDSQDYGSALGSVIHWFEKTLTLVSPDSTFRGLGMQLADDPNFLVFVSSFLKGSSTGVERLNIKKNEITEDELRTMMPEKQAERILNDTRREGVSLLQRRKDHVEVILERGSPNKFYTISIGAVHATEEGKETPIELGEESDGTRRLLHLLPALYHLDANGGVFFIDEIDRSMHPLLVWEFLKCFLSSCSGDRGQIIVTTHECHLLDHELLRRDEIWFSEKKKSGASTLYSLSDFNPRKDLKLDRHYLEGRFGAVPFLGDLSRLIAVAKEDVK